MLELIEFVLFQFGINSLLSYHIVLTFLQTLARQQYLDTFFIILIIIHN